MNAAEPTLPDYLQPGLRLVFVGINPGHYSAEIGHYYGRPGNLFWWALSNSGLVKRKMGPDDDSLLIAEEGIGLTDVVKRATHSSGELRQDEFDEGAKSLTLKIKQYEPKTLCFVGLLGATAYLGRHIKPGPQTEKIGATQLFALPSPSRRNAHYGQDRILGYFRELNEFVSQTLTN